LLVAGESPGIGIWVGGTLVIFAVIALQRQQVKTENV